MEGFKTLFKALILELENSIKDEDLPTLQWSKVVIKDSNSMEFPIEIKLDIHSFYRWMKIETFVSFKNIISFIKINPELANVFFIDAAGNLILNLDTVDNWVSYKLISPFIIKYLKKAQSVSFNEDIFNSIYEKLLIDIQMEKITIRHKSALLNLELAVDEIILSPDIKVRKVSIDELESWINRDSIIFSERPASFHQILRVKSIVEIKYEKNRFAPMGSEIEIIEQRNKIITLLRLQSNRNINVLFSQEKSLNLTQPYLSNSPNYINSNSYDQITTIDETECNKFVELWGLMINSPNADFVSLALRRWDSSNERSSNEDKIVDYWIALESLFTSSDGTSEVTFRASLRIAAFLGGSPEEKRSILAFVKNESYILRSIIVHGSKNRKGSKKLDVEAITEKTRDYLRKAIFIILKMDKPFDPSQIEYQLLGIL